MDKEDNFGERMCIIFTIIVCVLMIWGITFSTIDTIYKLPEAAENANQICQSKGFDYYEDFQRIGFLSTKPVAIKCKYVTNYQEMDIALRQTFGGIGEDLE